MTDRPVPVPDDRSAPYWNAAAQDSLVITRCQTCRRYSHPPDVVCPHCGEDAANAAFEAVPGTGRLRSWTVIHQSFIPGFETPYVVVDVELDEVDGVRLIGRLLDGGADSLDVDTPVEVAFERLGGAMAVPAFRLLAP